MSAVLTNQIPSSLQKMVKKVSSFRISRRQINPSSSSSVSQNGLSRFQLPTSGLHDLGSATITATITPTINASTGQSDFLESYFRRVSLTAGGQTISSLDNYNSIWKMMDNTTRSTANARNRYAMTVAGSLGYKPTFVATQSVISATDAVLEAAAETGTAGGLVGNLTEGTPNTVTSAAQGCLVQRHKYNALVSGTGYHARATEIFPLHELGVQHMSLFPQVELEIQWAGAEVLSGGDATNSWTATNLQMFIDYYELPAYTEALLASISAQQPLTTRFTRWVVQHSTVGNSTHNQLSYDINSSSLKRVWFSHRANGYTASSAHVAGNCPPYGRFDAVDTNSLSDIELTVDGVKTPSYRLSIEDAYEYTLNSLGVKNNLDFDNQIESYNDWLRRKFCVVFPLSMPSATSDEMCGYNTGGGTSQVRVDAYYDTAAAGTGSYMVAFECDALLTVLPGRAIDVAF